MLGLYHELLPGQWYTMHMIYTDGHPVNIVRDLFANTARCNKAYTHMMIVRGDDIQETQIPYERDDLTSSECELYAMIHACSIALHNEEIRSDSTLAIKYTEAYHFVVQGSKLPSEVKIDQRKRMTALGCIIRSLVIHKNLRCVWTPRENNPITWKNQKRRENNTGERDKSKRYST